MKTAVGAASLMMFALFAGCADDSGHSEEFLESQAPKAKIDLKNPSSALSHTSTMPWSLSKTGVVNEAASTVTWSINATQGASGARRLVVAGSVNVRNTGGVGGPIGNVVVRLQTKSGSTWTTRASDVANATNGDAATSVRAVTNGGATTISETAGSGTLSVPISPQVTVAANSTLPLGFTATFNNDVLNIPQGTVVRAEIIVTFGNAGGGNNPTNVDINGNGSSDLFETRVDGVAIALGDKLVPGASNVNTAVTLSDTAADLSTSGTVTYTNAVFTIGATSGTVQLSYNGGVDGGSIANCAHLTGTGVDLTACSTQMIAPEPWTDGDVVTFRQVDWGGAAMLSTPTPFSTVYPSGLIIGVVGMLGQGSIELTTGPAVLNFLPTSGTNLPVLVHTSDPTVPLGGQLSGEIVALTLNIDFGAAGLIGGTVDFGNVYVCNVTTPTTVSGSTVEMFLATANTLLSGGSVPGVTRDDAAQLAAELNAAFLGGVPSAWAHAHLSRIACP